MNTPIPPDWTEEFDERELMLQRFIDNDLDSEERLRFLEMLDQDPALRRKLLETERLIVRAGSLPRFTPPSDLTEQVMKRVKPGSPGILKLVKDVLCTPRVLYWNPAKALIAASVLLVVGWGVSQQTLTFLSTPATRHVAQTTPSAQVTPVSQVRSSNEQEESLVVRLILVQPEAHSVTVAGDFNSWMPHKTPLRKMEDGIWTVTLHVKPGRYHYMFVIDGEQWVPDPSAEEYSLDGFGSKNSVLDVATTL